MNEQKHMIKRQLFELFIPRPDDVHQFQSAMSRLCHQRMIPLINTYCMELSEPDRLYRIETLQLELGVIDIQDFETSFMEKLRPALYQALAEQIRAQRQMSRNQDPTQKLLPQLELFAFFARYGSLPWWVETAHSRLLEETLQQLMDTTPELLRQIMRELVREPQTLQRITYHYGDELLGELVGMLCPPLNASFTRDPGNVFMLVQKTDATAGRQVAQIRNILWSSILYIAAVTQGQQARPRSLLSSLLIRVASALDTTYVALLTSIYQQMEASKKRLHSELHQTIETLYQEIVDERRLSVQFLAWLVHLEKKLRIHLPQLPISVQAQIHATLDDLESYGTNHKRLPTIFQRLLETLETDFSEWNIVVADLSPVQISQLLTTLRKVIDLLDCPQASAGTPIMRTAAAPYRDQMSQDSLAQWNRRPANNHVAETAPPLSSAIFDARDELYISNAGLVILWPFLHHFFGHLGLLEKSQFRDFTARQRGVKVLQYLATQEPSPPEYLLPLNKILCGMEIPEVFDRGVPLLESEIEDCTNLLNATIMQAPILRNMSIPGFRNTFLLREGILSTRDGVWLLRVERETYDIVLERFPWGWSWVKLPWMERPLQVEW